MQPAASGSLASASGPRLRHLAVALACCCTCWLPAHAVQLTWFGGNGAWDDGANWLPGGTVPGPGDQATLGAGTVALDTARTVGTWTQSGGTLAGSGGLTVLGAAAWTGGRLQQAGVSSFAGSTSITGDAGKSLSGGLLELRGATTWGGNTASSGNALLLAGGRIVNRSVFTDANVFGTSMNASGSAVFENQGSYVKTGASTTIITASLFNAGSVAVHAGALVMQGSVTGGGSYTIDAGASVVLTGGGHVLDHVVSNGAGTLGLLSLSLGGLRLLGGEFNSKVSLGVISGDGAVFRGDVLWGGGGLAYGPGRHRFEGNVILRPNDNVNMVMEGATVELAGNTTWEDNAFGGHMYFFGGTVINSGTLTDLALNDRTTTNSAGTNLLSNSGTWRKTGAATTRFMTPFANTGLVDVQQGVLRLDQDFTNRGQIQVAAGARLESTARVFANEGALFGGGHVRVPSGQALVNRGELGGGGRGTTGTLVIDGDLELAPGGTLVVDVGGGAQSDRVHVFGGTTLGGHIVVNVLPSATLFAGQSFMVLVYDRLGGGSFDSIQWQGAGGFGFVAEVHAQDVTLRVVAVPEPAAWVLFALGFGALVLKRRG